ncbi:MAG TPA: hypothetical protein ENJ16_06050 [Planctomycetaceae bacterium]|nr:hypothetical protein [Planctomycetaceae bacterium]
MGGAWIWGVWMGGCLLVAVAAHWMISRSWRARVLPRVRFFAGAVLGAIALAGFAVAVPVWGPLGLILLLVYVVYLIHLVVVSRLSRARMVAAASARGIPIDRVLAASRVSMSPFDRKAWGQAVHVLESGGTREGVLAALRVPKSLRLLLGYQALVPGSLDDDDIARACQREFRLADACQRRGGHWLYVAFSTMISTCAYTMIGFVFATLWMEFFGESSERALSEEIGLFWAWPLEHSTQICGILAAVLVVLGMTATAIGVLQFTGMAPFAPWSTPRAIWVMRLLPAIAAAVRQRVPLTHVVDSWKEYPLPWPMQRLIHDLRSAEESGRSWADALFSGRGMSTRDRRFVEAAMAMNNLPWVLDRIADRIALDREARMEAVNAVLFSAMMVIVALLSAALPVLMAIFLVAAMRMA